MKLYAMIHSERTSKGQGGNKELSIELTYGNKERAQFGSLRFFFDKEKNEYALDYFRGVEGYRERIETKILQ